MNKIKIFSIMLLVLAAFFSCEQEEKTTLEVSTREIVLDKSGLNENEEPVVLEVNSSNTGWILTCTSWLTPSVISGGIGVTEILVSAAATTEEREGYITVQSGDVRTVVTVKQMAEELVPSTLTVLSPPNVDANGLTVEGNKPTIKFSTNKKWIITGLPKWITATPTSGNAGTDITITLAVNTNNGYLPRVAVLIINAGARSEVVLIQQAGEINGILSVYPLNILDRNLSEVTITEHGNYFEIGTFETAVFPMFYGQVEGDISGESGICMLTFEYQVNKELPNPSFGFFTSSGDLQNWVPGPVFWENTSMDPNNDDLWQSYTFNLSPGIDSGWGNNGLLRFDFKLGGVNILIRDTKIVVIE
jgi:hypothetical protein